MRINTNMAALNAWRSLSVNSNNMTKSLEKLSSGYRVNRAADDAAGLAVSEKMRAQIRGLNMAIRNAQDGVSLIQTAEGGAQKIQDILQRMRELAVQASSGTLKPEDRDLLNTEFEQLIQEIDRTANSTTFNNLHLINDKAGEIKIQVGANTDGSGDTDTDGSGGGSGGGSGSGVAASETNTITLKMSNLTTKNLNISDLTLVSKDKINDTGDMAREAIAKIDEALNTVSTTRAEFGAYQNRLEAAIETLQIQAENLTAAESRIRDVDMALEMATFTKYQILQQASTAMLAQANMSTQAILSLLR